MIVFILFLAPYARTLCVLSWCGLSCGLSCGLPMVLPLCYCARPHVGAATLNYHRDVKIHQGHTCCVSSALRVLHDPCGGVVVWYSAVFCVLRFKKGFWVCGSGGVFESCTFYLHDGRANRGCPEALVELASTCTVRCGAAPPDPDPEDQGLFFWCCC